MAKKQKKNENAAEVTKKETRLRVWLGIFYPESTKPNWREILESYYIPCCVSPLHDQDAFDQPDEENIENVGTYKKPHYHIVFRFAGSKSYNQVWDILRLIAVDPKHCPPPERPYSDIARCVQYLIHANDKSKHQYLRSDINPISNFDYDRYFRLNAEEEDDLFCFLMDLIIEKNIVESWDLFVVLRAGREDDPEYDDAFRFARSHYITVNGMITSLRNKTKGGK